ncbi:hypothetical protein [Streptosporangium sp. NPDC000396]|uniref:hypothetical protein n=1 Tax=Streptosporangium sp. NPDC000396 TaxID=3366185 RepID=UPI0036965008
MRSLQASAVRPHVGWYAVPSVCAVLSVLLPGIGIGLWGRGAAREVAGDLRDVGKYGAGNPAPPRSYGDHFDILITLSTVGLVFALAAVIGFVILVVRRSRSRKRLLGG